jgi:hypothetical protein
MVKNRPPASILPPVNKRLIAQYIGRNVFALGALGFGSLIFLYKFYINANSLPFLKSRKSYSFQADPYSGKVSCNYQDVPNYQHGY